MAMRIYCVRSPTFMLDWRVEGEDVRNFLMRRTAWASEYRVFEELSCRDPDSQTSSRLKAMAISMGDRRDFCFWCHSFHKTGSRASNAFPGRCFLTAVRRRRGAWHTCGVGSRRPNSRGRLSRHGTESRRRTGFEDLRIAAVTRPVRGKYLNVISRWLRLGSNSVHIHQIDGIRPDLKTLLRYF